MRISLLSLAFLMWLVQSAPALDILQPRPTDPVPASGATYLDLVRLIVPDMAPSGDGFAGHDMIELRHAGGEDMQLPPEDPIRLGGLSAIPLDGNRLLLLAELGRAAGAVEGVEPLALFDLTGTPKLLDSVDVGFDVFTAFAEPALLDLGDDSLVMTASTHWNSSQSYLTTVLSRVDRDRIDIIDTLFTFSDTSCTFERRQVPALAVVAGADPARPDIVVTVTETTTRRDGDCGDEPPPLASTRQVVATFRWDAAEMTYKPDSDALDRLRSENVERF